MKKVFPLLFAIAMMPAAAGGERSLPLSPEGPELVGARVQKKAESILRVHSDICLVHFTKSLSLEKGSLLLGKVLHCYKGENVVPGHLIAVLSSPWRSTQFYSDEPIDFEAYILFNYSEVTSRRKDRSAAVFHFLFSFFILREGEYVKYPTAESTIGEYLNSRLKDDKGAVTLACNGTRSPVVTSSSSRSVAE